MTPEHLDWVEISDHASDGLSTEGVAESMAIGRIKNLHGFCYKDTEEGGYNLHCPDLDDLIFAYTVLYNPRYNSKTAVVKTVFRADNPGSRFSGERFIGYNLP